jgi:hypothetical protein
MQIRALLFAALVAIGAVAPALAAGVTLTAKQVRGMQPELKAGAARGVYVWTDDVGLHVRWLSDGPPVLFTGSVELDRAIGKITRVNPIAGGWVTTSEIQMLLFSATATDAVDGFDLELAAGTTATFDAAIDGLPIDVALLSIGTPPSHPTKMPVRFVYR